MWGNGPLSGHPTWPATSSCSYIPPFQPHLWPLTLRSGVMVSYMHSISRAQCCLYGLEKPKVCFRLPWFPWSLYKTCSKLLKWKAPSTSRTWTGKGDGKNSSKGDNSSGSRGRSTPPLRGGKCWTNLFNTECHLLSSLCICRHWNSMRKVRLGVLSAPDAKS